MRWVHSQPGAKPWVGDGTAVVYLLTSLAASLVEIAEHTLCDRGVEDCLVISFCAMVLPSSHDLKPG